MRRLHMLSFVTRLERNDRRTLLTCFYAFFCSGLFTLTLGSVMPDLKASYGLSDSLSGVLLSVYSAGNLLAGLFSALVPLYLGQRRAIMLLGFLAVLGYLLMILTGSPLALLVAFLIIGFGKGSLTNFNNRMVNQLTGGNPAAANILHASFAVGAVAAPMVFLALRNAVSWPMGLSVLIVCGCASTALFGRMRLREDRPSRQDRVNRTLVFMKNPSFLILAMMMFCYLCSEYSVNGWLVTYLQSREDLAQALAGMGGLTGFSQSMASLLWMTMLVGRLICAALTSRIRQKHLMLVSSMGAACFYLLLLQSGSLPMVAAAVAGLGLSMAGICPMIYSDAAPFTNAYPMATSILLGFGSAGAMMMSTLVGALAERFGFTGGMSAILAAFALLVVFALLNVVVRTRKPQV